jgi:hypothetical protein
MDGNKDLKIIKKTLGQTQEEMAKLITVLLEKMNIQEIHQSVQTAAIKVTKSGQRDLSSVLVPEKDVQKGSIKGKGGFGAVYSGTFKGAPAAIKELLVSKLDFASQQEFLEEALMMR